MPEKTLDLLAIGDCSMDLFMRVNMDEVDMLGTDNPQMCFLHGSKIHVTDFSANPAGNSCHVVAGAQLLGLKTSIYTELGDDQYADEFINEFKKRGIDTTYCIKNTGTYTNVHPVIAAGNERTIFVYHEKRTYKLHSWPVPKWIHYSSLPEGFQAFQKELIKYINLHPQIGVAFNPSSLQIKDTQAVKEFIQVTDILFVNLEEAQKVVGNVQTKEAHQKLHELGAKLSIITDGAKGSTAYDGKHLFHMGIYNAEDKIADKTGVGDAYSSAFMSAISCGKSLPEAMKWGTFNSHGVLREIGGINGLRTREEIEQMVKSVKLEAEKLL